MIDRLKPTAIISVPSFLKRVAAYADQQGCDLAQSTVRKLICIGEPVRNPDWTLTPLGSRIAPGLRAQVFSTYGNTELASSLCECQAGQGGHSHPQLLHVEILDDAGRPVPDGREGQLVATTIGVEAMPLIRFATGDVTFLTRRRCPCGLWTPHIGPILGRRDQAMKIKGTTVYPAAVQRALQGLDDLVDYIMIATAPTALSDELEIIAAWPGNPAAPRSHLRKAPRRTESLPHRSPGFVAGNPNPRRFARTAQATGFPRSSHQTPIVAQAAQRLAGAGVRNFSGAVLFMAFSDFGFAPEE